MFSEGEDYDGRKDRGPVREVPSTFLDGCVHSSKKWDYKESIT